MFSDWKHWDSWETKLTVFRGCIAQQRHSINPNIFIADNIAMLPFDVKVFALFPTHGGKQLRC